jgi:hypothetical protein
VDGAGLGLGSCGSAPSFLAHDAAAAVDGHGCSSVYGDPAHHVVLIAVIVDRVVLCGAIVPNGNVTDLPLPAHGVFEPRHVILEQLEQAHGIRGRNA